MRVQQVTDLRLSAAERRHVVRRTWRFLRPVRLRLLLAVACVLLQAAATLAGPAIVRYGIDHGVQPRDVGALDRATIAFVVSVILVYVFGRLTITAVARIGEGFLRELRQRVFAHLMRLSLEFYDRTRTGALVARMTADVEALQELVTQGLSMFLVNILVFAGAVVVMVGMSWELALGVLFVVPVLVMATRWFRRESNAAYLTLRDRVGGTLTSFQEGLAGVRVVQAFNQADAFRRRFRETNEQQFRTHLRAETITARYTTVIELTQGTAIAVTLFYGGWLTGRGVVTVGTLAAFVLYLQNLFEPMQQMSQLFNTLQAAGAALHKLYGLLDEDVGIDERLEPDPAALGRVVEHHGRAIERDMLLPHRRQAVAAVLLGVRLAADSEEAAVQEPHGARQ